MGASLVFLSALICAVFILISGETIKRVGAFLFGGLAVGISCILIVAHIGLVHAPRDVFTYPSPVYGYAIVLAVFGTVAPALLMSVGLKRAGPQRFAVMGALGPVATLFLAWAFLGERPGLLQGLGLMLALAGGVAIAGWSGGTTRKRTAILNLLSAASCATESRMRVVTHNAFWFQGKPYEGDQPGPPDPGIVSELANVYRALAPDVLCLQEVHERSVVDQLCAVLEMEGQQADGAILTQYGGAILWREGRLCADNRRPTPQRIRMGVTVPSSDGKGDTIWNVHLPSSRQLGREAAAQVRLAELEPLVRECPDVIAGDFNERPGGELDGFMARHGYHDAAVLAGAPEFVSAIRMRRVDRIWVHQRNVSRVSGYGVVPDAELTSSAPGKVWLSDHVPLWIDLDT